MVRFKKKKERKEKLVIYAQKKIHQKMVNPNIAGIAIEEEEKKEVSFCLK